METVIEEVTTGVVEGMPFAVETALLLGVLPNVPIGPSYAGSVLFRSQPRALLWHDAPSKVDERIGGGLKSAARPMREIARLSHFADIVAIDELIRDHGLAMLFDDGPVSSLAPLHFTSIAVSMMSGATLHQTEFSEYHETVVAELERLLPILLSSPRPWTRLTQALQQSHLSAYESERLGQEPCPSCSSESISAAVLLFLPFLEVAHPRRLQDSWLGQLARLRATGVGDQSVVEAQLSNTPLTPEAREFVCKWALGEESVVRVVASS